MCIIRFNASRLCGFNNLDASRCKGRQEKAMRWLSSFWSRIQFRDSLKCSAQRTCLHFMFITHSFSNICIIKFQPIYDRICHCEYNWNHFRGSLICYLSFDDQWMINKRNNIPVISNSLMLFVVIGRKTTYTWWTFDVSEFVFICFGHFRSEIVSKVFVYFAFFFQIFSSIQTTPIIIFGMVFYYIMFHRFGIDWFKGSFSESKYMYM